MQLLTLSITNKNMTLSIPTLDTVMLSVANEPIMLSVIFLNVVAPKLKLITPTKFYCSWLRRV
jgi:hypothetical protein